MKSIIETSKNKLFYISKIAVAEICLVKPSSDSALIWVAVCFVQRGIVSNSLWNSNTTQSEEHTGYAIHSA